MKEQIGRMEGRCISISLALLAWLPASLRADPLDNWTIRDPLVPPGAYYGVTFGNGSFVAYNSGGTVVTSADGKNWSANPAGWGSPSGLNFANGQFYLGYGWGNLTRASDGRTWTAISWPANNSVTDVAYGNGRYVATTELDYASANLTTSTSGATGTWGTRNAGVTNGLEAIAFGSSRFVAVGRTGTAVTSVNGTSWTVSISGTVQNLWSVTYASGQFVAVGDAGAILTSPDGATWTSRSSGSAQSLWRVSYGNGLFVVVGDAGTLLTSGDGINWTARTSGVSGSLRGVTYGVGFFVAVGDNTTLLSSPDGINWTAATTSLTSQRLTSAAFGLSNYVAVGFGGTVLSSPLGANWTSRNSGTSLGLYSVSYGNGTFAAVGQIILSSPDGINWTTRDSGANYDFEAVAYLNGAFMTVGGSGVMKVSTDGLTWTARNSGTVATLYGLAYGNGLYIVVGAGGTIRTSPDGLNWTSRTAPTSQDLNGVIYGGGLFVAQGNAGVILTSPDGTNWTSRSSGTSQGLSTTAYGFGYFVTVGMNSVTLTSTNGTDWVTRYPPTSVLLIGIAAGPTNFVSVGDSGWILESDPFPPFGIARQPRDQTAAIGGTAQFSVEPWGASPIGFQWRTSIAPISGATNPTLTLANVQLTNAGGYRVVVSNISGVATSSVATLTVVPLLISPQPLSQTAPVGATVIFNSGAQATPPFSYQWRKEGYPIAGATSPSYTLTNVQFSDAGAFTLFAGNPYGSVTSTIARLTVTAQGPVSSVLFFNDYSYPTSPYQQALNNLGLNVQSFSDTTSFATALNNANAPTTLAVVDVANYSYDFSALSSFLSRGGRAAMDYWGLGAGPVAAAFEVSVPSTVYCPQPLYDWGGSPFFTGLTSPESLQCLANINGQTLQPAAGAYAVGGFVSTPTANQAAVVIGNTNRSLVTGVLLVDFSSAADAVTFAQNELQFLLTPPPLQPVITFQPQDQATLAGQPASVSVVASGSATLSYQWFFNQTNVILGATSATYSLGSVQYSNVGSYSVRVANAFGAVTSRLAAVTLISPPVITGPPQNQTVTCGSNAAFNVTATGTLPLSYQWRKNGVEVSGATASTLTVTPLTCQTPDNYTVVITNVAGAITSNIPASLTVVDTLPPTISCPANLVLSTAPGQCSATGNYTVTATDNCAVVSLVVSPPSGSVFPKGTNVVMCVATDCAGNSNTCVFTVTVVDQEPPVLSCPTNQTVACNSTNGAQAFFTPTAADNCDGSVPVICTPTSGSYFGLGTNTVLCVASDSTGNTNSCTFTVVVFENPPTLSLTLNGATCALTWPQRCAAYVVEQKSSLDPAENWATVTNTPAVSGNSFAVTVPLDSAGRFFRLKQN